jgi:hypothetical protein
MTDVEKVRRKLKCFDFVRTLCSPPLSGPLTQSREAAKLVFMVRIDNGNSRRLGGSASKRGG